MKDLIRLLFDASLLISGFNVDESTQFAGGFHQMTKLSSSIGDDDDLPLLEEVEGVANEAPKVEEVD